MSPGIHLVHKPEGPTSFSLVQECIESTPAMEGGKRPRVCHGGTLDPFASGLLLILVEPATRLFDHLHAIPKVYEATVRWGIETDNGDPGGEETFTGDASGLNVEQLDAALATFVGWQDQIPHATSAKRIDGERAYLKAHRGETVVMPASRVYLHEARWLGHHLPGESRMRMVVRGGYYVRALARDLGRLLGCGVAFERFASERDWAVERSGAGSGCGNAREGCSAVGGGAGFDGSGSGGVAAEAGYRSGGIVAAGLGVAGGVS